MPCGNSGDTGPRSPQPDTVRIAPKATGIMNLFFMDHLRPEKSTTCTVDSLSGLVVGRASYGASTAATEARSGHRGFERWEDEAKFTVSLESQRCNTPI